ncbi:MAG: SDR family oxidoreductase [Gammaproteobacteria bacterium]|nr:SDR family oxidoreductase [Gammaproteobacteria bacterium]MBV9723718.1 SDR family oxidoreductase [Gammaproteobacteria bacterium]
MKCAELFSVAGRGAIVTGAGSGLGLAIAEALAENGARVTLLDIDAGRIEAEIQRLARHGYDVRGAVVDVSDHAALEGAFDAALAAHGRLDIVFANAGVDSGPGFVSGWFGANRTRNPAGALESYSDERWNRVIDVNLTGVFATLRAAARRMKSQRSGKLIVTTSVAGYQCEPAIGSAYMAAKAGAAHLMRCVAHELAAYNITVNAIAPGFFVTNIGGGHAKDPEVQRSMAAVMPMHRVGFPEDIKGLALFLASPASAYLTGQQITIDGGWTLGPAD